MPILRLPDDTARLICSSLVLNDAVSVIKELVDNGLDAGASSILVEISNNTLDIVQVKDNGLGIGVEDRQLLCKRGCTSKIRTFEDVDKLGGASLGFRGEALASISELSENVTLSTRVDGEPVGTVMKFGPQGQLLNSASASHPVGTTVRVQSFLKHVPVRKQTALKVTARTLVEIKKLLFAFAFARSTVRFVLKVLKAKNDKANWDFPACSSRDEMEVAASRIVGKEVSSFCQRHAVKEHTELDKSATVFKIRALLLRDIAAGLGKTSNHGQYIVIDGRPLSSDRGTMKDICQLYKSYLQHWLGSGMKVIGKPFFLMYLDCPNGSYDVNIEPAKNEVLFQDPDRILNLVRKLFSEVYGDDNELNETHAKIISSDAAPPAPQAFDLLLARKPSTEMAPTTLTVSSRDSDPVHKDQNEGESEESGSYAGRIDGDDQSGLTVPQARIPKVFRNMYGIEHEDIVDLPSPPGVEILPLPENEGDAAEARLVVNPFTTAAMYARASPLNSSSRLGQCSPFHRMTVSTTSEVQDLTISSPTLSRLHQPHTLKAQSSPFLPTPSRSPLTPRPYQNPGPPIRHHGRDKIRVEEEDGFGEDMEKSSMKAQQSLMRRWTHSDSSPFEQQTFQPVNRSLMSPQSSVTTQEGNSIRTQKIGLPDQRRLFVTPWAKGSQSTEDRIDHVRDSETTISKLAANSHGAAGSLHSSHNSAMELEEIMVFEHRKAALNVRPIGFQAKQIPAELAQIQRRASSDASAPFSPASMFMPSRMSLRPAGQSSVSSAQPVTNNDVPDSDSYQSKGVSDPHKNRYFAAVRSLDPEYHVVKERSLAQRASMGVVSCKTGSHNMRVPQPQADNAESFSMNPPSSIPQSDPRGYFISHLRKTRDHVEEIVDGNSQPVSLRMRGLRSSQLPLETIPAQERKHDLVCTPTFITREKTSHDDQAPIELSPAGMEPSGGSSRFAFLKAVSRHARTVTNHDSYMRRGDNSYIKFQASTRDVLKWQSHLEGLIRAQYRANVGTSLTSSPSDNIDPSHQSNHNLSSDETITTTTNVSKPCTSGISPNFQINLATAIKAHLYMLEDV